MRFSATEAAFEGFRVVRRNPMALVYWTLTYLVLSVSGILAMIANRGQMVEAMQTLDRFQTTAPTTPEEFQLVFDAYGQMTSYSFWILPVSLVIGAVLSAAIARGVLTPDNKRFGYVRLGMDEVRVLVVTLVLTLAIGLIAGVALTAVTLMGVFATVSGQAWMWLFVVLGGFAVLGLIIWLSVRWCLAVPITVAERKFAFFDSFRLTRGRFWPLLGMAIVAAVMGMIIWALSMLLVMPLGVISGISSMGMGGDPAVLTEKLTLANPLIFLNALANAIVYALMVSILYAPFAAAYRDLKTAA